MPTPDRREALTHEAARARIEEKCFPAPASRPRTDQVGLEPECFPIRVGPTGAPRGRVLLEGAGGSLEVLDALARESGVEDALVLPRPDGQGPPFRFDLAGGGQLTFEPGGQLEHSTAVHATGAAALDDAARVTERLVDAFGRRGVSLAFIGIDLWNAVADVPQLLDAPRYRCMASYFDERGEGGRTMMRNTASTQVNLDLGPAGVDRERWLLANLASPLVTATFASSPAEGAASARAQAWQLLDPTRTGFPAELVAGAGDDPVEHYVRAVLDADVMIFWRGAESRCGTPGFRFRDWLDGGHAEQGWPTRADLDYHLTTLFLEVRPRGFLELRSPDALPPGLRAVPAVLLTGLLYDERARRSALAELEEVRGELDARWRTAAAEGLADARTAELASRVWPLALDGARRLPAGYFRDEHLACAHEFLDAFALAGRTPADELRALSGDDPARTLAWAARTAAPCGGASG